jgi:clan AA aspartic protease (TIGR02281 family)
MRAKAYLVIWVAIVIIPMISFVARAELYKWIDEKGNIHFTDDDSKIPEKYRTDAESRKVPKEATPPSAEIKPPPLPAAKSPESQGFQVHLSRRGGTWETEVMLNGKVKRTLIVDTGASFVLIDGQTAKELDVTVGDDTPIIPMATASGWGFVPLVTLKSVRVGDAEVQNVEAVILTMPSGGGLLGNTFLNKFGVNIDSTNEKMTLSPTEGKPSLDHPGGHSKDYWVSQFRFYNQVLADLNRAKIYYQRQGKGPELRRVDNAIQYFENQLNEWERRASIAGVPRSWRMD